MRPTGRGRNLGCHEDPAGGFCRSGGWMYSRHGVPLKQSSSAGLSLQGGYFSAFDLTWAAVGNISPWFEHPDSAAANPQLLSFSINPASSTATPSLEKAMDKLPLFKYYGSFGVGPCRIPLPINPRTSAGYRGLGEH